MNRRDMVLTSVGVAAVAVALRASAERPAAPGATPAQCADSGGVCAAQCDKVLA